MQARRTTLAFLAVGLAVLFALPADAQLPLGTATPVAAAAQCGFLGGQPRFCQNFTVNCPGALQEPITGRLRWADTGTVTQGTIVLTTGGGGQNPYGMAYVEGSNILIDLMNQGYRVVELYWPFNEWWDGADGQIEGLVNLGCRPATLAKAALDTLADPDLPFCATGQSGGGSQLAYPLTHYNFQNFFDAVVLTGSPTFSDFILGCFEEPPCEVHTDGCYSGQDKWAVDKGYGEVTEEFDRFDEEGPCFNEDDDFRDTLEGDSLALSDTGDRDYPDTVITFLVGDGDMTNAVGQQLAFKNSLGPNTTVNGPVEVLNTGHPVPDTVAGKDKIEEWLEATCTP